VLVVDDDLLMRWSLRETLRQNGYTVVEAPDARTAIETISDTGTRVDVVVLNIRLPESDDLSIVTNIRRLISAGPVIITTARGSVAFAQRALDHGAYCVLDKPFEMEEFANIVDHARLSITVRENHIQKAWNSGRLDRTAVRATR
jgi:DNA-binding NtrC family response regulator